MNKRFQQKAGAEKAAATRAGVTTASLEPQTHPAAGSANRWTVPGICLFLALIVWMVFGQTLRFDFINFDDSVYVYKNPAVIHGLTLEGVKAAFSTGHSDNWVPLTTLSHMLDCQLFGLNAGNHHLINVVLQIAAAILLFLVLREMTGCLWRSAFIAAVFAIHPLRVESVAWVSERKDVLCGVFFMLTLWTYVRYVRSPKLLGWYLATLFLFLLALLSKPSVVTLPFLLLLLDYWPLNRLNSLTIKRLVVEKIPFFLLSLACCVPTMLAERPGIKALEHYPLYLRIENSIVSYVIQMERLVYPANLAMEYPYPANGIPWWQVALSAALLAGICVIVWLQRRKRPWLLVGWLWYLGMLVPNIGFIQVGAQAQADRHTYLPQIGLVLLLAWLVADACAVWRHRHVALASISAAILVALVFCARAQTAYWRDSQTLWSHAIASTSGNYMAHNNLADFLMEKGQMDAAITQFQLSVDAHPDPRVYDNLGNALQQQGNPQNAQEAYSDFEAALRLLPNDPNAYFGMGNFYLQGGQSALAIQNFQKALQINPVFPMADYNLGNAYIQDRQMDLAIQSWQKAVDLQPGFAMAHNNLGNASVLQGRIADAVQHWKAALQSQPNLPAAQINLAWVLAVCPDPSLRDGPSALALAQNANGLSGGQNPMVLRVLAAAFAENGQFADATATAQQALQIVGLQGNPGFASALQSQLKCYQNNQPFRDSGLIPRPQR
jgi:tetratricopeptide (TPR) repeat protein